MITVAKFQFPHGRERMDCQIEEKICIPQSISSIHIFILGKAQATTVQNLPSVDRKWHCVLIFKLKVFVWFDF